MAKKKVKIWTEDELIKTFKLRRIGENFMLVDNWLAAQTDLSPSEQEQTE